MKDNDEGKWYHYKVALKDNGIGNEGSIVQWVGFMGNEDYESLYDCYQVSMEKDTMGNEGCHGNHLHGTTPFVT